MLKIFGPRDDSPAHKAICRLVDLGGKANTTQLMQVLGAEYRSVDRFQMRVTDVLQQYRFVIVRDGRFFVTELGKQYVGQFIERQLPVAVPYTGQVAQPRTLRPGELNMSKYMAALPIRPGAFDHQQIPSLMGGSTVIVNGKAVVVGEQRVLPGDRAAA